MTSSLVRTHENHFLNGSHCNLHKEFLLHELGYLFSADHGITNRSRWRDVHFSLASGQVTRVTNKVLTVGGEESKIWYEICRCHRCVLSVRLVGRRDNLSNRRRRGHISMTNHDVPCNSAEARRIGFQRPGMHICAKSTTYFSKTCHLINSPCTSSHTRRIK